MRKSIVFALMLSTPMLAACASLDNLLDGDSAARQAEMTTERLDQMTKDINACGAHRIAGEASPRVAYGQCINRAFQSAMADVNYPYPDIVATLSAERLRVAEAADKNQITDTEGQARLADKISEVIRLERARAGSKHKDAAQPQYFLQLLQIGL